MSELDGIKLNPDNQLLLESASLRLPFELSRRNLKTAQKHIEKEREHVLSQLKAATAAASKGTASKQQTIAAIDSMIARMTGLQNKLKELEEERQALNRQARARIEHIGELWNMPTVADVRYEAWSKVRLDRLLVDYMLRQGHIESARLLAKEKGIEELVDVDIFTTAQRISEALRSGSLTEALAWCSEHKPLLKNLKSTASNPNLKAAAGGVATAAAAPADSTSTAAAATSSATGAGIKPLSATRGPSPLFPLTAPPPSPTALEFQLRLQQCISLLHPTAGSSNTIGIDSKASTTNTPKRDVKAARQHAAKYLAPHIADTQHGPDVRAVSVLLVIPGNSPPSRYAGYYSSKRWHMLADLFMATFLELWGLPRDAGLKRALKAGLTALKTPSCHSKHLTPESVVHGSTASAAAGAAAGAASSAGTAGPGVGKSTISSSGIGNQKGKDGETTGETEWSGTVPGTRLCPICSTELNALARDLPYAHHSQSLVDADPVVLPNDRIYGRDKLRQIARKMDVRPGAVKDPVTGEEFDEGELRKVYIM